MLVLTWLVSLDTGWCGSLALTPKMDEQRADVCRGDSCGSSSLGYRCGGTLGETLSRLDTHTGDQPEIQVSWNRLVFGRVLPIGLLLLFLDEGSILDSDLSLCFGVRG